MTEELQAAGAFLQRGIASPSLPQLLEWASRLPQGRAGTRITHLAETHDIFTCGPIGALAKSILGATARPVRAIYFDKSAEANWSLDWHQDRTIHVREMLDVSGFGPWTTKTGLAHVAPPQNLLNRMITVRVHLDPVGADNAPLRVAAGSHLLGRISEQDIEGIVAGSPIITCQAEAGDAWFYSTPILHASDRAIKPSRRRVIQLDYAAFDLPGGLTWGLVA